MTISPKPNDELAESASPAGAPNDAGSAITGPDLASSMPEYDESDEFDRAAARDILFAAGVRALFPQGPDIVISYEKSKVLDTDDEALRIIGMFTELVEMVGSRSDVRHQVCHLDQDTAFLALFERLDAMPADVATAVRDLVAETARSRRPAAESAVRVKLVVDVGAGRSMSPEVRAMLKTPIRLRANPITANPFE